MSTLQDRLLQANDSIKRVLRDEKIRVSGIEMRSIVFDSEIERDIFGDEIGDNQTYSYKEIPVILPTLEEIPLSRLRKDLSVVQTISKQSLYLYDVLPLQIKTRFTDTLEQDDIIVIKIFDEKNKSLSKDFNKPFYMTLRVVEVTGYFSPKSLTDMKFNVAPYTQKFSQEVIDIIESF
jgi:hypothetical protein